MTAVNAEDIEKPGGLQRLLDSAVEPEGRSALLCEQHDPSAEMRPDANDVATCPNCGNRVRLVWVENE